MTREQKTEAEIAAYSTLVEEANGVKMYTQNLHYNVHYVVCQQRVFTYYGFPGPNTFKQLSQMTPDEQREAIREHDENLAKLFGIVTTAAQGGD